MENTIFLSSINKKVQNIVNEEIINVLNKISSKYDIPFNELQTTISNNNNNCNKCLARKQDGLQCTRNKKNNSDYCGKHINNRKYGRIDDNNNKDQKYEKTHIEMINGNNYLIDEDNYVYTNNIENPKLIGIKENGIIKFLETN